MSDPTSSYTTNEGGQQQQPQFFTEDQVNAIIDQVTKRVRETQLAELEQRIQGSSLPEDIQEELDGYNPAQLQKALQRYKKAVPKYNNEEWNTPEEINPNFIKKLKQWKVDSHHLVTTIYRLTETTRLQARVATEIYEQLQFVAERGWQLEDGEIVNEAVEKVRRLAVFGYGIAKAQEDEAIEETTEALRLPHSIKHLESPAKGDKNSLQKQQGNQTIKQTTSTDEEEEAAMDIEEGLFSLTGVEDVGSQVVRSSTTSLHPRTATTAPTATTNKEDQKHCCLDSTPSSSTLNHIDSTSNNLNNNQPLFYPKGWDITRRTTQAFFEKLETSNNSSVALISSRERLQASIFEKPNPLEEQSSKIVTIRAISNQHSSEKISTCGDHTEISNTESSILIDFLHDTRRDKATTNSELYKIESVPSITTLQNGGCTSLTRYSGERRFFVQDRFKGCIRRGADSSRISEILNIRKWRITLRKGYPSNLLSRRHLHHGKVQRKDEADGESNTSAFGRPWIPNQQGKECVRAEDHSRISWISFQYTNNDDIVTTGEDKQTTATFTTSREVNSSFVPMDGQFTWKDDSSNSSNWRSLITHTSPTTRSREEPTTEQSQLGQDMPDIPMGEIRDSVVEDVSDQEKRTTDTTGAVAGTISHNLCGRIRCDLLCSSNARKKIKQHGTSHLLRQQNGPQIRHKSRGNSIFRPSRFGGKDSRPMQPTPVTGPLSTYSGSREYQSRSIESSAETNLRDDSTSEDVSATLPDVGKNDESRRVHSLSQLSTAEILELSDGSFCGKDRRVSTELETERPLHVPPVEINSKSFTENESRQNEGSSSGHPTVENPILVSHDSTFQPSLTTNRMEDTARELEFNRLAIINNKRKSDGMNEGLIDHLNKAASNCSEVIDKMLVSASQGLLELQNQTSTVELPTPRPTQETTASQPIATTTTADLDQEHANTRQESDNEEKHWIIDGNDITSLFLKYRVVQPIRPVLVLQCCPNDYNNRYQADIIPKPVPLESNIQEILALSGVLFLANEQHSECKVTVFGEQVLKNLLKCQIQTLLSKVPHDTPNFTNNDFMEMVNVVSAVDEEGMSPKSARLRLLTLATSMNQFKSNVVEGIADL
ncbi:hypothetical protein G6F37_010652 [Rhizopus arrhizus]|nr:hypothetical protein G6F37_010652 [Rhizopus arrhizus]